MAQYSTTLDMYRAKETKGETSTHDYKLSFFCGGMRRVQVRFILGNDSYDIDLNKKIIGKQIKSKIRIRLFSLYGLRLVSYFAN